jgi:hypothetical protein
LSTGKVVEVPQLGINQDTYELYFIDHDVMSTVPMRSKKNPSNHWVVPFVTGKNYYIRWEFGLDFEGVRFEIINWVWKRSDRDIKLTFVHYDVREAIYVDDNSGKRHLNNTIGDERNANKLEMGDNVLYNDTDHRVMTIVVNSKDKDVTRLDLTGVRCIGYCQEAIEDVPLELEFRYWSIPEHWDDFGRVPIEGDEAIIQSGWNMIYDIEDSPKLESLEVRGKLTF